VKKYHILFLIIVVGVQAYSSASSPSTNHDKPGAVDDVLKKSLSWRRLSLHGPGDDAHQQLVQEFHDTSEMSNQFELRYHSQTIH
jgi:hypothetical protein